MIGTSLSHFRITAKLGEGGMGEVYRAEDTKLGREVAIKVLPEAVASDPERLARFEREAKVLASLNHPHIAAIYSIESAALTGRSGETQGSGPGVSGSVAPPDHAPRSPDTPGPLSADHDRAEEGAAGPLPAAVDRTVHFLVMELVEGEDLTERIARGAVPVEEAVPIALQMAEALEAAHEKGIIHRDLKPANLKVDSKGGVKILDFGLAKALDPVTGGGVEPGRAGLSMSPTLTAQMTQAGVLLGTAAYMSPEQAAGEPADRRADNWAFGVVLAEMLTGRRLFEGKSASHVLASVLKEDPDWNRFPRETPPAILDLVQHCLRKDPSQRLQAIGDARIQIEDYLAEPDAFAPRVASATAAPAKPLWREILPWALFGLAAVAPVFWRDAGRDSDTPEPVLRASILPPEDSRFYLAAWNPGPAVVSPDGEKIAFSIQEASGVARLWVRPLDSPEAEALPGTEGAAYPFWGPDSRWIGFFTDVDQTLKKIDTQGGPPVTVCAAENGKGGSWNEDGTILLAPRSDTAIYRVDATGGDPTPVTSVSSDRHNSHRHPRFLPDGRHFLYLARAGNEDESALMLGSLDGAVQREILRAPAQGEYAAGHILFPRGNTLMAQPFDPVRLELSGEASPLVDGVSRIPGAALAVFSASESGLLAFQSGDLEIAVPLEWRNRSGTVLSIVGEPAQFGPISLSPDGERLAAVIFDSAGLPALWLADVETGLRTRFTFDGTANLGIDWSPGGDSVIYSAQVENRWVLNRQDVDGVGETETLLSREQDIIVCNLSPDGNRVLFWHNSPGTSRDLWTWTLDGAGEPIAFRQSEADERCGSFSPDGRWVAYAANDSGRYEIYVTPFPGPGRRWQVSEGGGLYPMWQADGGEIVYHRQDGQLMAVSLEVANDTLQIGGSEPLFQIHPPRPDGANFSLSPDRERLIVWTNKQKQSDAVLNLVVNWPAELARKDER